MFFLSGIIKINFYQEDLVIKVLLPDGSQKDIDSKDIEKILDSTNAIAIKTEGKLRDINFLNLIPEQSTIEIVDFNSTEGKEIYRHSASHIMAHAVKDIFPDVKLAIGPSTEVGFYYDFERQSPFNTEDLEKITKKMQEIIKKRNLFKRKVITKKKAMEIFREKGETYKIELLEDIEEDSISIYEEGDFIDLCKGPHIDRTDKIKSFKLLSIAGAYWRGNEKNKMLQRIYGTAFYTKEDLQKYLDFIEEVKKRDHRKLGKELDLFSIQDEIGSGLILWHPNGAIIRKVIEDFWRDEHIKANYKLLYTPHIARLNLWQQSGHCDFYRENMYSPMDIDGVDYELKPMNCPFHISIFKSSLKSYRDLPVRYAELGTVYRYEKSGVLHGLLRVRGFTQDDAHIFCREDQLETEIFNILDFTLLILKTFGFSSYNIYLSTMPEKYVGSISDWQRATESLKSALEKKGLSYQIDLGEGVFYGPKIDIKIKDSLNRAWQCSTIQVDFNNPDRFDITYRGSDSKEHKLIMIHRALMGSLERFFGVLIEHYLGNFPLWLCPVQVNILTITEQHQDYAQQIYRNLLAKGIRTEINLDNEKIGYKIREATIKRIPYLIIIGDKEISEKKITIRKRQGENIGMFKVDEFIEMIKTEIKNLI